MGSEPQTSKCTSILQTGCGALTGCLAIVPDAGGEWPRGSHGRGTHSLESVQVGKAGAGCVVETKDRRTGCCLRCRGQGQGRIEGTSWTSQLRTWVSGGTRGARAGHIVGPEEVRGTWVSQKVRTCPETSSPRPEHRPAAEPGDRTERQIGGGHSAQRLAMGGAGKRGPTAARGHRAKRGVERGAGDRMLGGWGGVRGRAGCSGKRWEQ